MGYAISMLELSGLNILLALSVYATLMVGQFSLAQVGFWVDRRLCRRHSDHASRYAAGPALLASGTLCAVIGILSAIPAAASAASISRLATVRSPRSSDLFHKFRLSGRRRWRPGWVRAGRSASAASW